jgi:hypothetical protein
VAGVRIVNRATSEVGTIGLLATRDGRTYVVSCRHVLLDLETGTTPGLYQPDIAAGNLIAVTGRYGQGQLDGAAAEVMATCPCTLGVVGRVRLAVPTAPREGMAVWKCGAGTGFTRGVIRQIGGERLVAPPPDAPFSYRVTRPGDSGALFVEAGSNRPVALCRGERNVGGRSWADTVQLAEVLADLGLDFG